MNSFFKLPALLALFYFFAEITDHVLLIYFVIGKSDPLMLEPVYFLSFLFTPMNTYIINSFILYFVMIFVCYCHHIYQCTAKNVLLLLLIAMITKAVLYLFYSSMHFQRVESFMFIFTLLAVFYGTFLLFHRFFDTTEQAFPFSVTQIKSIHCHFYCFLFSALSVIIYHFYIFRQQDHSINFLDSYVIPFFYYSAALWQFVIYYFFIYIATNSLFSADYSSLQFTRLFKSVGWSLTRYFAVSIVLSLIYYFTFSLFIFVALILSIYAFFKINRLATKRYFGKNIQDI